MDLKELKKALLATLPVLTGYLVLGIGFGVLMGNNGYGLGWSVSMSAFIYAGSMQYLGVELLATRANLLTVALATLMVNARHLFYGVTMVEKYRGAGWRKPYLIFSLTDETYSLVCTALPDKSAQERFRYYFCVSVLDHAYWIIGALLGALAGKWLGAYAEGVNFALTALFVTVFLGQWIGKDKPARWPDIKAPHRAAGLMGIGCTVLCRVLFGAEYFLIPSMLLILLLTVLLRPLWKGDDR